MATGGRGLKGSQTGSTKKDPITLKDVQEQRQRNRQEQAAQLIERVVRGCRVRLGFRRLEALEDAVLQSPMDADTALAHLLAVAAARAAAADTTATTGPTVQPNRPSGSLITHSMLAQCLEVDSPDDEQSSEQTAF
eukprot:863835-Amphidinium_carterae.1